MHLATENYKVSKDEEVVVNQKSAEEANTSGTQILVHAMTFVLGASSELIRGRCFKLSPWCLGEQDLAFDEGSKAFHQYVPNDTSLSVR